MKLPWTLSLALASVVPLFALSGSSSSVTALRDAPSDSGAETDKRSAPEGSASAVGMCIGCFAETAQPSGDGNANGSVAISAFASDGDCDLDCQYAEPCPVLVICDYALNNPCRYSVRSLSSLTGEYVTLGEGLVSGNGSLPFYDSVSCGDKHEYVFKIGGMTVYTSAKCSACQGI